MKTCFKCGDEKELNAFYKHPKMPDGHVNKCKECNKRDVRENRAAKIEYYRAYDAERFQTDPRVKQRISAYQKTAAGKRSARKAKDKWQEHNAIKRGAAVIVGNAVRDGRLYKPGACSECGAERRIHGHHDDYAFPLVVRWLCSKCHTAWHKQNGEGLNG